MVKVQILEAAYDQRHDVWGSLGQGIGNRRYT